MPLTLVRGSYQVIGASPDGDSVRFTPRRPAGLEDTGLPQDTGLPGAGQDDGTPVRLDVAGLRASVDHQLLAEGLVYPTSYSRLYLDLRAALVEKTVTARRARLGVCAADQTTTGFIVTSREQVQHELVVLPELFRRLADHRSLPPPDGRATSLDSLVQVDGNGSPSQSPGPPARSVHRGRGSARPSCAMPAASRVGSPHDHSATRATTPPVSRAPVAACPDSRSAAQDGRSQPAGLVCRTRPSDSLSPSAQRASTRPSPYCCWNSAA